MKKSRILLILFTLTSLLMFWSEEGSTRKAAPPAGRTGAPPSEQSCTGTGCHSGSPVTGSITFNFGTGDTAYEPGQTYPITLTADDISLGGIFGFEMTSLDSNNIRAGTLSAINTSNTWEVITMSRTYVGHKNATTNRTWTFNWEAPVSDAGPVSFYVSVNSANNNGFPSGDRIYKNSFTVPAKDLSGIGEVKTGFRIAAYTGLKGRVYARIEGENPGDFSFELFDLQGRLISSVRAERDGTAEFTFSSPLSGGIYLLKASSGNSSLATKVLIF